jgi:hypothetical protein
LQCDVTCQALLTSCNSEAEDDVACKTELLGCDQQFLVCVNANPATFQVVQCIEQCQCDPAATDCPCLDNCDALCDASCAQAIQQCKVQVGNTCGGH